MDLEKEPRSPLGKLLTDNISESSEVIEPPTITFNASATIQQKLAVITQRFEGFTNTLVQEKTKILTSQV